MSKPRVGYRAGDKYMRTEEADDPKSNLHGLVVGNSPDIWMINLRDGSGKHFRDKRPPHIIRMPVFPVNPKSPSQKLASFEFTKEVSCARGNGVKPVDGGVINGASVDRYDLVLDGTKITLWAKRNTEVPVRIASERGGRRLVLDYIGFEQMKFDPILFKPPAGIRLEEH